MPAAGAASVPEASAAGAFFLCKRPPNLRRRLPRRRVRVGFFSGLACDPAAGALALSSAITMSTEPNPMRTARASNNCLPVRMLVSSITKEESILPLSKQQFLSFAGCCQACEVAQPSASPPVEVSLYF